MQFKTVLSERRAYQSLTISKKDIESKIKTKARDLIKKDWAEEDPYVVTREVRFIFGGKRMQSAVEVHFSRAPEKEPGKKYTILIHIEYDNHKTVPIGIGYVSKDNRIFYDMFDGMN